MTPGPASVVSSGSASDEAHGGHKGYAAGPCVLGDGTWGGRKDDDGQLWLGADFGHDVQVVGASFEEPTPKHAAVEKVYLECSADGRSWETFRELHIVAGEAAGSRVWGRWGPQGQYQIRPHKKLVENQFLEAISCGIWALWWDRRFDHADYAHKLLSMLEEIRKDCLKNVSMADPPNHKQGECYNVIIHNGKVGFGNGQGTEKAGIPFLTMQAGTHDSTIYHEGFHIFQYSSNSKGYRYSGNSAWYIEASANWYAATKLEAGFTTGSFVSVALCLSMNPHIALWHGFNNGLEDEKRGEWLYSCHQYALGAWLFYLTDVKGVPANVITDGFYAETEMSPQEYHFSRVGAEALRSHFADWASSNTGGFDYLTEAQRKRAEKELTNVTRGGQSKVEKRHEFVATFDGAAGPSDGWRQLFRPVDLAPRGWAYNVVKVILKGCVATYTVRLKGDIVGSEGQVAHFAGRLVVTGAGATRYMALNMADAREGSASVDVGTSDIALLIVIASVPQHFDSNQTYGYELELATKA